MSPDLNDTDLERELQRRADSARLPTDWARFELLPSVRLGLGTRAERVPSPRLAPLGGIAAIAAVLVLLVVALPRFVPGPQSSSEASPTPVAEAVIQTGPPSPTTALPDSPPPSARTISCHWVVALPGRVGTPPPPKPGPTIIDETGLVRDCMTLGMPANEDDSPVTVSNWDTPTYLEVTWLGNPCDIETTFTFRPSGDSYELTGRRPDVGCDEPLVRHRIVISLSQPVSSELVAASVPSVDPRTATIECSPAPDPMSDSGFAAPATIHDETGLLESCEGTRGNLGAYTSVSNPDGDLRVLRLDWMGGICDADAQVTFSALDDGYNVHGILHGCILSAGKAHALLLHLRADVNADDVLSQFDPKTPLAPTASPSLAAQTLDCTGAPEEPEGGSVRIEDHTGWVRSCVVSGSEDPGEPEISSKTDPPSLTVSWQAPCAADPMRTLLELWYRAPHGPEDDPSRFQPPFLMVANRVEPGTAYGCLDVVTGRQVQLVLDQSIAVTDVELFLTLRGRGIDRFVNATQEFELTIGPDTREYLVDEAIEVSASLASVGESTVTGWVGPFLGIEQLDGDLAFHPGPLISICPETSQLTADEPLVGKFNWPTTWSPRDPNADFYAHRVRDGELFLPPGVYRMYAWSRFSIGDTCSDDIVDLRTSIIVHVR